MILYSAHPVIKRLRESFEFLYGDKADICARRTAAMAGRYGIGFDLVHTPCKWNQRSNLLITYGDMIRSPEESPLTALNRFACKRLNSAFNTIHLLPFFPYSSDDGFSVIHFRTVNPELGTWDDIQKLGRHFRLMFDLVLNHVSRESGWFRDYETGVAPGRNYFIETDPSADLSAVARPRSKPLLTTVNTISGEHHIWTTFSSDQLDLNYANFNVLFEMLDILLFYVSMGSRIIRLDAIAYLWKSIGTTCINLPETHEIVKIFRAILDLVAPDVALLTETNVPHEQNISYFGNGDEAQLIYQFSLPPLALHALLTGNARYLNQWATSLTPPPEGCAFLNFTASHDGIGVRPLEDIAPKESINDLLQYVRDRGGKISTRRAPDGTDIPYELNITYYDALSFPDNDDIGLHITRFMCSQIMALSLQGIPAVYFNSLVAARNDHELAGKTGQARSLNRTKWNEHELETLLDNPSSEASRVFNEYIRLLKIRGSHTSFHPTGEQRIPDFGDSIFAVERTAPDGEERVMALHNVTGEYISITAQQLKEYDFDAQSAVDLISGKTFNADIQMGPYEAVWLLNDFSI